MFVRSLALAVALSLPVCAVAQTPPPPLPEQGLFITTWIGQLVQKVTNLEAQNADLHAQIDKLKVAPATKPTPPETPPN